MKNDSVAALSQLNGQVVERYAYDVFGQVTVCDAGGTPRIPNQSAVGNPILFTGRRLDTESGLYDYRARIYSPALGRFLQTDPLGTIDGMNLYAYVNNNPLNWVDPWGLCREEPGSRENPHKITRNVWRKDGYYMIHYQTGRSLHDMASGVQNKMDFLGRALNWDSRFHDKAYRNDYFDYEGTRTAKGSELNYYAMGMLMARAGMSWEECIKWIYAWKIGNMPNPTYNLPTDNEIFFMRLGWHEERRRMRQN